MLVASATHLSSRPLVMACRNCHQMKDYVRREYSFFLRLTLRIFILSPFPSFLPLFFFVLFPFSFLSFFCHVEKMGLDAVNLYIERYARCVVVFLYNNNGRGCLHKERLLDSKSITSGREKKEKNALFFPLSHANRSIGLDKSDEQREKKGGGECQGTPTPPVYLHPPRAQSYYPSLSAASFATQPEVLYAADSSPPAPF